MIEKLITELTEALRENTEAIKQSMAQVKPADVVNLQLATKPEAKKATAKKAAPEPEPEPEAGTVPDAGLTDPESEPEVITPTKVAAPARTDDTPNVPSTGHNPDGSPLAAEHVDVDEVISEINATVKGKLLKAGDDAAVEAMKTKWSSIRKGKFGVDRIADLRGNPAQLLAALREAKGL